MKAPISALTPSVLAESAAASVSLAAPCARLSLRAQGDLGPLDRALGFDLPRRIGRRGGADGIEALCLGPDEWMVQGSEDRAAAIRAACAELSGSLPHSLVDVSAREVTSRREAPVARQSWPTMAGCPRDIDAIPAGEGRRTVFDGTTIVLWRDDESRFRMDCWHSFAPHLSHLLAIGCRELAAEPA